MFRRIKSVWIQSLFFKRLRKISANVLTRPENVSLNWKSFLTQETTPTDWPRSSSDSFENWNVIDSRQNVSAHRIYLIEFQIVVEVDSQCLTHVAKPAESRSSMQHHLDRADDLISIIIMTLRFCCQCKKVKQEGQYRREIVLNVYWLQVLHKC